MATLAYMQNRQKYTRPQAILFADNSGTANIFVKVEGVTANLTSGSDEFVLNGQSSLKPGYHLIIDGSTLGLVEGVSGVEISEVAYNGETTTVKLSAAPTSNGTITFDAGPVVYTPNGTEFDNFIILTDDNRQYIDVAPERIEKRERMINGRMRSYHIADKVKISSNWDMVPSKAFVEMPNIASTGVVLNNDYGLTQITSDGGAAGADMKEWYDNNIGSFWVYLSYDNYKVDGGADSYDKMVGYDKPIEMFFSSFAHTVQKRGGSYDYWNVQLSLEEV
jgi:hypothetical protein